MIDPFVYEEWKPIDFFGIKKNLYLISNFGNIFSYAKNGILIPAISNGYLTVQLCMENGKRETFYIHRLVAFAFAPNKDPSVFVEVNHENLFRDNNLYLNLKWVTKEENIKHELLNKNHGIMQSKAKKEWGNGKFTYGENNGMAKLTEKDVRIMLSSIESGSSYKDAIIAEGFEPTDNMRYNLSHIVRGHRWKHLSKEFKIPNKIPK